MKLHLALDTCSEEEIFYYVESLSDIVQIFEIGTPYLLANGLSTLRKLRKSYPDITIFADCKIIDGATIEARDAFEAGADIVSVVALANDQTILDTIAVAKQFHKKVLVDFIAVSNLTKRAVEIEAMGADILCVHTGFDVQKESCGPLHDLTILKANTKTKETAAAGGVTLSNIDELIAINPDIIIVGGGITNSNDPIKEAKAIYKKIEEHTHENK